MSDHVDRQPTILLVGTGHWSKPGLDYASVDYDDMLAPGRQREIEAVLDRLTAFAPTKVALEFMPDQVNSWNAEYRSYRQGRFGLTANERHQLGFRLAAMADHTQIHGIDWHDRDRAIGWDKAITFARTHDQADHIAFFVRSEQETEQDRATEPERIRQLSVREQLREVNAPVWTAANHRIYIDLVRVGDGSDYVGADVVLRWYERNLKIFVNVTRLITALTDRVLVVIGAGHLALLTHFVAGSGRFALECVSDYM